MTTAISRDFKSWLKDGKPGEAFVYHEGDLAVERFNTRRMKDGRIFTVTTRVAEVADAAWQAYEDDLVILVQKRLDVHRYQYLAVLKRSKNNEQ